MKKLVVLTGAGISSESGIQTFRDADGLWEGYDVREVATPEGWQKNQELVLKFYNERRQHLHKVHPNLGHKTLVDLEKNFDVSIITQNIDNLHEKAGSSNVLHLHGELFKARSVSDINYIIDWEGDLKTGDLDAYGNQLRPHIVWFGEEVPALDKAIEIVNEASIIAVIGTSMQVYPAAGLIHFSKSSTPIYYIDPNPAIIYDLSNPLEVISMKASKGVPFLRNKLLR